MKLLLALIFLAQLLIRTTESFIPVAAKRLDCHGPEAEQAATAAVDYINSHALHGYKYDLNRVEDFKVKTLPSGDVYKLELDLLETECHVVDPTPLGNCTVRSRTSHAVSGDCDVHLVTVEGKFKVNSARCHSSPDSAEDFEKICPNCPHLTVLNDTAGVEAANLALADFNVAESTVGFYKLLELSRVTHTHVPVAVHVEFAIVATNCSSQEAKDDPEQCHLATGKDQHFGFCKASVYKTSDQGNKVDEVCTVYDHQPDVHHSHLTVDHFEGKLPPPGRGHSVLDLRHSHNSTHVSAESHSEEVRVVGKDRVLAKRASMPVPVPPLALGPNLLCPGNFRHFKLD